MRNETWKTDRDLLSEAYDNVSETTHSPENSCKDDEYYCEKDKVCKKKETANEKQHPQKIHKMSSIFPTCTTVQIKK